MEARECASKSAERGVRADRGRPEVAGARALLALMAVGGARGEAHVRAAGRPLGRGLSCRLEKSRSSSPDGRRRQRRGRRSQDAPAGLLYGGGCYSITSAYSTPALTVSTTTWAGAASAARPVLDACNQVQQVWLQPGTLEQGGGLERES